jgi:hypothetical protein
VTIAVLLLATASVPVTRTVTVVLPVYARALPVALACAELRLRVELGCLASAGGDGRAAGDRAPEAASVPVARCPPLSGKARLAAAGRLRSSPGRPGGLRPGCRHTSGCQCQWSRAAPVPVAGPGVTPGHGDRAA